MTIEWTRINSDVNGNSRHVCHFLNLNTRAELDASGPEWIGISDKYERALKRARKLGGRKFHNKQYGGGIVFQVQQGLLADLERSIAALLESENAK